MTMDSTAELERIRQFTTAAKQRIRRLDILLDEQIRILDLDPSLNGGQLRRRSRGHLITRMELRIFGLAVASASVGAFLAGFWMARFH